MIIAVVSTFIFSALPVQADVQPSPGQLLVHNRSVLHSDGSCTAHIVMKYALKLIDDEIAFRATPLPGCGYNIEKNEAGNGGIGTASTTVEFYSQILWWM